MWYWLASGLAGLGVLASIVNSVSTELDEVLYTFSARAVKAGFVALSIALVLELVNA